MCTHSSRWDSFIYFTFNAYAYNMYYVYITTINKDYAFDKSCPFVRYYIKKYTIQLYFTMWLMTWGKFRMVEMILTENKYLSVFMIT